MVIVGLSIRQLIGNYHQIIHNAYSEQDWTHRHAKPHYIYITGKSLASSPDCLEVRIFPHQSDVL